MCTIPALFPSSAVVFRCCWSGAPPSLQLHTPVCFATTSRISRFIRCQGKEGMQLGLATPGKCLAAPLGARNVQEPRMTTRKTAAGYASALALAITTLCAFLRSQHCARSKVSLLEFCRGLSRDKERVYTQKRCSGTTGAVPCTQCQAKGRSDCRPVNTKRTFSGKYACN